MGGGLGGVIVSDAHDQLAEQRIVERGYDIALVEHRVEADTLTFRYLEGFDRARPGHEILGRVRKEKLSAIPGDEIFKLYDTYGFPLDLVEETAKDAGFNLDLEGFNRVMQEQKEKAAASWKGSGEKEVVPFGGLMELSPRFSRKIVVHRFYRLQKYDR